MHVFFRNAIMTISYYGHCRITYRNCNANRSEHKRRCLRLKG
jgi:hypothetical protein